MAHVADVAKSVGCLCVRALTAADQARARLETGLPDQILPLGTVRSSLAPVFRRNYCVGGFVADDFAPEASGTRQSSRAQLDYALRWKATAGRAKEARVCCQAHLREGRMLPKVCKCSEVGLACYGFGSAHLHPRT